jgi:hypothetical protein
VVVVLETRPYVDNTVKARSSITKSNVKISKLFFSAEVGVIIQKSRESSILVVPLVVINISFLFFFRSSKKRLEKRKYLHHSDVNRVAKK